MRSQSQSQPFGFASDLWILSLAGLIFLSGLFVGYRLGTIPSPKNAQPNAGQTPAEQPTTDTQPIEAPSVQQHLSHWT